MAKVVEHTQEQPSTLPSVQSNQEPTVDLQKKADSSDPALFLSEAEDLKIPVRLQVEDKALSGYTQKLGPEGFQVLIEAALPAGTPLTLQCAFGEVCYLNLSGQVVFCRQITPSPQHTIGIKFSGLRDFEKKVLVSAVQELKQNTIQQEKSLLTLHVSEDSLALESVNVPKENREALHATTVSHSSDEDRSTNEKPQTSGSRKKKKFTQHPAWVMEMNRYLDPYRRAIWECKLVQETSSGALSLKQVKGWSIQFYPFIESFPQFMAVYLAKAPDPMSRAFLIDNLRVEKRHADQWIDMAKGFGVPREELFNTPIVPQVEALTHWMWSITTRGSFAEAVAATNYAIEGVTQGIASIMVKGFIKYHGKDGVYLNKNAYYWMEAHSSYDDLHPAEALEMIKLHATSSGMQQRVVHAAQRSLEYLFGALEACYDVYHPEASFTCVGGQARIVKI